jgi:Zn-dependent protease
LAWVGAIAKRAIEVKDDRKAPHSCPDCNLAGGRVWNCLGGFVETSYPLVSLFLAVMLISVTAASLRGGLVGARGMTIVGMDPSSLGLGALAVGAAAWYWGPSFGVAIMLAVMIHEFGHVAAFRVCGHRDARFRLIPLMGGVAISDQLPASQMKDFFITLLGPGISVAPMVLAYVLSDITYDRWPEVGDFLYVFAGVTAAMNFFNLLPFWPLDGGRCVRILAFRVGPKVAHGVTILMSAALAAAALQMQSLVLLMFALMGAQGIMQADTSARVQGRLTWGQWAWSMGAYLATAGAHVSGAWWLLEDFI